MFNKSIFLIARRARKKALDVYGHAKSKLVFKNILDKFLIFISKFSKVKDAGAFLENNEEHLIGVSKFSNADDKILLRQSVKATVYTNVHGSIASSISIDEDAKIVRTDSVFSKIDSGVITSEDAKALKTSIPKFTKSVEAIDIVEDNDNFITIHRNEAEVESSILALQNIEGYVNKDGELLVRAGNYHIKTSYLSYGDHYKIIRLPIHIVVIPDILEYTGNRMIFERLGSLMAQVDVQLKNFDGSSNLYLSSMYKYVKNNDTSQYELQINFQEPFTVLEDTVLEQDEKYLFDKYFEQVT